MIGESLRQLEVDGHEKIVVIVKELMGIHNYLVEMERRSPLSHLNSQRIAEELYAKVRPAVIKIKEQLRNLEKVDLEPIIKKSVSRKLAALEAVEERDQSGLVHALGLLSRSKGRIMSSGGRYPHSHSQSDEEVRFTRVERAIGTLLSYIEQMEKDLLKIDTALREY